MPARCKLWGFPGTPPVIVATIKRPSRQNNDYPEAKGGGLFKSRTPTIPPSRPPKVFEPVFLQFEILGESAGAKRAKFFFGAS